MPLLGVFGWPDGLIVLGYFALVIYVGFAVARRDKSTGEYFLGGRSMPDSGNASGCVQQTCRRRASPSWGPCWPNMGCMVFWTASSLW